MELRWLFIGSFLFSSVIAGAQSGCTDPAATNYNASATVNDGSCIYPVTHKTPVLRGALNHIITESSGLEWTDGKLWTHNDSGNPPQIFSIDTTDGHTLQTIYIDNYPNIDWEDITADSQYIYVGDHGNNDGDRTDLKVLKIAKADISNDAEVHVNAGAISFSYTDQTSFTPSNTNNFDCEALMSVGDSLYIFTKDRGDLKTRVYKMPKVPGTYALSPYTTYNVAGLITGADYNAHTHEVVLIGYLLPHHTNSFLWLLDDFEGDMFFSGNKRRIEIGGDSRWQTEGITYVADDRYFISCETDSVPASLYISDKNFATTAVPNITQLLWSVYPNPASNALYVDRMYADASYSITNMSGQKVFGGMLYKGNNKVDISMLLPGMYTIELHNENEQSVSLKFDKK